MLKRVLITQSISKLWLKLWWGGGITENPLYFIHLNHHWSRRWFERFINTCHHPQSHTCIFWKSLKTYSCFIRTRFFKLKLVVYQTVYKVNDVNIQKKLNYYNIMYKTLVKIYHVSTNIKNPVVTIQVIAQYYESHPSTCRVLEQWLRSLRVDNLTYKVFTSKFTIN